MDFDGARPQFPNDTHTIGPTTSTLLTTGQVLLTGFRSTYNDTPTLNETVLYNFATNAYTIGASMNSTDLPMPRLFFLMARCLFPEVTSGQWVSACSLCLVPSCIRLNADRHNSVYRITGIAGHLADGG
jgi:hypothetical protein